MEPAFVEIAEKVKARRSALKEIAGDHLERFRPDMTVQEWMEQVRAEDPELAEKLEALFRGQKVSLDRDQLKREKAWENVWQGDFEDPTRLIPHGVPGTAKSFGDFRARRGHPDVAKALDTVKQWVAELGTPIVVLAGVPGTGKTHLSQAAGLELLGKGRQVFFRTEADLVGEAQSRFASHDSEDLIEAICQCGWLILDDLGAAALGEWGKGLIDRVINNRYALAERNEGRTLVSTNLKAPDMPARMASRLQDQKLSTVLGIRAPDYRVRGK